MNTYPMKKYSYMILFLSIVTMFISCSCYNHISGKTIVPQDTKEVEAAPKKILTIDEIIVPQKITNESDTSSLLDHERKLIIEAQKYHISRDKSSHEFVFNLLQKYINPGEKVIDLGCGHGYYTFFFSQLVGKNGKVYASDLNPVAYLTVGIQKKHLSAKYSYEKFDNITPMLNNQDCICQKKDSINLVWMSDVHVAHVRMGTAIAGIKGSEEDIQKENIKKSGYKKQQTELYKAISSSQKVFFKSIYDSLEDGGYFILAEDITNQPEKLQKNLVIKLMEEHNFKLIEDASRPNYHLLVFKK